jgi:hypothetical protein
MNDEVAFSVIGGKVEQLTEVSLEDIGFRERKHLQRWIEDYPEIVGPDLLVVTTECDRWALGSECIRDRLDVLFLNSTGALVVAELKRGEAPDTVDLQALKYAAYCSRTRRRCPPSALRRARPWRTHPEGEKPRVGLARRPGIRVSRRSLPYLHTGRALPRRPRGP